MQEHPVYRIDGIKAIIAGYLDEDRKDIINFLIANI